MHKIFWKTSKGEEKVFISRCEKHAIQWISCLNKGNVKYKYKYDKLIKRR